MVLVDIGHFQVPWQYNTLCDWTTSTLLSVLCGQTLAVCIARPRAFRWWAAFGVILLLHLFDLLFELMLIITGLVGGLFFPHLMGTSSGILGLTFCIATIAFIIYHYYLVRAICPRLSRGERIARELFGLSLAVICLLLCARIAPDYDHLYGGAGTVLFFGARAIIPYCFWSCIQYPTRLLSSYFTPPLQRAKDTLH